MATAITSNPVQLAKGSTYSGNGADRKILVRVGWVAQETPGGGILEFWGDGESFVLTPSFQLRALVQDTQLEEKVDAKDTWESEFARQTERLAARVISLTSNDITGQLKDLLRDLGGRMGTEGAKGKVVLPPFTHQDIARYLGTSREVVTLTMNRLRFEGLVTYKRREGITLSRKLMEGQ